MSDVIANVRQREDGTFVVQSSGPWIKANSMMEAEEIAAAINRAYRIGKAHARREVRLALGLSDWGGQVHLSSESK